MTQQIPPHILNVFRKEDLIELLGLLAPAVDMEVDTSSLDEITKEDLLTDLSWIINQVGVEMFMEVVRTNREPVVH